MINIYYYYYTVNKIFILRNIVYKKITKYQKYIMIFEE